MIVEALLKMMQKIAYTHNLLMLSSDPLIK